MIDAKQIIQRYADLREGAKRARADIGVQNVE